MRTRPRPVWGRVTDAKARHPTTRLLARSTISDGGARAPEPAFGPPTPAGSAQALPDDFHRLKRRFCDVVSDQGQDADTSLLGAA